MRRLIIALQLLALLMMPATLGAQTRLGFLSYGQVLPLMPEYVEAQTELTTLRGQYDDEARRGEEEFQRKFTEFLQGQKDFPQNILLKRQAELQNLLENAEDFRREAERLVAEREKELMKRVKERLAQAIREVGSEGGYAFILNTDGDSCPFLNPAMADDVTSLVLAKLGIAESSALPDAPSPATEP